jgi:hypothetical protein
VSPAMSITVSHGSEYLIMSVTDPSANRLSKRHRQAVPRARAHDHPYNAEFGPSFAGKRVSEAPRDMCGRDMRQGPQQ